jgi:predicted cupin superfamily sugar epimerase
MELFYNLPMSARDANFWIERLNLQPHPEGGFFRQTYKSNLILPKEALPHASPRSASTAIYFLLEGRNFSAFHRLGSDEMWHFYAGSPLSVHVIHEAGSYSKHLLGPDPDAGQSFQALVPAGRWFASHVEDWSSYSLVGCTVAPGFDFQDFELAKRKELIALYPQHRNLVETLTRK